MNKTTHEIYRWQQKFYSRPPVFATRYRDGEMTGNIYDTRDGAQLEVDWAAKHQERGMSILPMYLHTDALAKERWSDD